MKRIWITNDEGIDSPGLIRLCKVAKEFGEVWVVAPISQRSACSHSLTLHDTISVKPHVLPVDGVKAFSCSGTPADCVRLGVISVLPERPDIVLSGINYGYNVATDIQYSGTAGAAFEAAFQGITGIAISEEAVPCHDITDHYLPEILKEVIERPLSSDQIWNINIPGGTLDACKGIIRGPKVSHGAFYRDRYKAVGEGPGGEKIYVVDGIYNEDAEEGTDFHAVVNKFISLGIVNNVK